MNRLVFCICMISFGLLSTTQVAAQDIKFPGVDKSPADIASYPGPRDPAIQVVYSRPMLKGREMLGKKIAYGKVWRTGANEATMITFFQDVKWGETEVAAGTYALFSIPGEDTWQVMLNKDAHQWGAYNRENDQNVATVEVPAEKSDATIEAMAIAFKEVGDKVHLAIGWENTIVQVPIEVK